MRNSYLCKRCGKKGSVKLSQAKRGRGVYCSLECYRKTNKGKNHSNWKGGKVVSGRGYILVYRPRHPFADNKGYVREHRLKMERYLRKKCPNSLYLIKVEGRKLRWLSPIVIIHHHDENRKNNSIKNLGIFGNKGAHNVWHKTKK